MGHSVHVFDVEHVIIDNLQFMLGSSGYSSGLDKFADQDRVKKHFDFTIFFSNFISNILISRVF